MTNELTTHFEIFFTMDSYGVGIDMLGVDKKACKKCISFVKK
jgi:hypothetical protein